ncbi:DUF2690 domain-containing protein [Streptomyces sp. NPDC001606]
MTTPAPVKLPCALLSGEHGPVGDCGAGGPRHAEGRSGDRRGNTCTGKDAQAQGCGADAKDVPKSAVHPDSQKHPVAWLRSSAKCHAVWAKAEKADGWEFRIELQERPLLHGRHAAPVRRPYRDGERRPRLPALLAGRGRRAVLRTLALSRGRHRRPAAPGPVLTSLRPDLCGGINPW